MEKTRGTAVVPSRERHGEDGRYGTGKRHGLRENRLRGGGGVLAVDCGPQINFTWASKLSAQVGADLPVSIDNSGLQVVPDYRVHGAFTWRF